MEILDNEMYSDIISWLPNGKGFRIKDKKRFADEVMPKHFDKARFTSFTRKLNRWYVLKLYCSVKSPFEMLVCFVCVRHTTCHNLSLP